MNLADLRRTLGVDGDGCGMGNSTMGHGSEADDDGLYGADSKARQRRLSMERMDLLKVCPPRLCLLYLLISLFTRMSYTNTKTLISFSYIIGQLRAILSDLLLFILRSGRLISRHLFSTLIVSVWLVFFSLLLASELFFSYFLVAWIV